MSTPFVRLDNVKKHFSIGKNLWIKAVDGINLEINRGETYALVGESGSGKTTLGKTMLGLYGATAGDIFIDGANIHSFNRTEKYEFTKKAQMIFQDSYASMDPRMTVKDIIAEGIDIHKLCFRSERDGKIAHILDMVGLNMEIASRFPHELSGGERQRVVIARALAVEPEFIICDEPISSLDVSVQAQIVNLLLRKQKEFGLTYLFIAHDLSMVRYISDRVGVMYMGKLMESAATTELYSRPIHPYTKMLLSSIPSLEKHAFMSIPDKEMPALINPPPGCRFASRCPHAKAECQEVMPELKEIREGHFVACHNA